MTTVQTSPVLRMLRLARGRSWRVFGSALLGAGAVVSAVGLMATSAWLISRAAQHPSVQALAVAVVAIRFFALARAVLRYAERLVGHDAALRVLADLRVRVYERLERLAPAGLAAFRSGDLLSRLVADVDTVQDLLLRVLPPYLVALLAGSAVVLLTGWLLPSVGVLMAVTLLLAALAVPALSSRLDHRTQGGTAQARGELADSVVDLLRGAPDLVAYGMAGERLAQVADVDAELTTASRAAATTAGIGAGLTLLLSGAALWGSVVLAVPAVRSGRLDGVLLAVLVLTPLAAFEAVAGLPAAAQALDRVRRSSARVFEVLDSPDPVAEPVDPAPLPDGPAALVVTGLRASYPGARRAALDGIDLDLVPGRRVAVVGPSGAGKSTLAAVLLRFLPYEGSVTLDGVELARLRGEDVRRRVGLAAQDAHVFDSTLEQNLRLARPDASAEDLAAALAAARLDSWVATLPDGLATRVGESGSRISGGQRQRLALARALLADFPVLVLDEPGEHLDTTTADALVADLLDATRGRSTVLITHRLAGLAEVDEVLVLDAGRVVERGTHARLLQDGGRYAALW
ncbi:MAG: thiol reductant ABC exporter subunit CydC, partial [Actinomycetes bacterium]